MKRHPFNRLFSIGSALAAALVTLGFNSSAATVTWGPAMQITDDADVRTDGTLVEADAPGNNSSPVVNGVTFATWSDGSAHLAAGPSGLAVQNGGFSSGSAPFGNLSSAYQGLLSAGINNPNSAALILSNLTIGAQYEVQIWANDAAGDPGAATVDGQTTLFYGNEAIGGQPGSFAVGVFTADATTQTINVSPTNGASTVILNALQLRSLPTGAPVALGVAVSPTNTTLAVATLTLTANASGTGLAYQWLSDAGNPGHLAPISGATGATLAINGTGVTATNQYAVVVSNGGGASTSSVVTVTLIGPLSAGITWSSPVNISGDSDVNTNGAGLFAYDANIYTNITVNGVTFTQFLPLDYYTHPQANDYGAGSALNGVTNGDGSITLTDGNGKVYYFNYGNYPGFGSGLAPFTNLSSNYQAALSGAIGGLGDDDTLTLVISNLYPGAIYGLQFWVNDSRSCCVTRTETLSDLYNDTVEAAYNTPTAEGGAGQYVLGEAIADANGSITVIINASSATEQINAFQLRSPSLFPPYMLPLTLSPSNFVYSGTTVAIAGGAVSPVGTKTLYQWQWNQGSGGSFVNYPGNATNGSLSVDTTSLTTGNYQFRLTANNAQGANVSQPVTLAVETLAAPVISGLTPAQPVTLYPNSAPLTLSATVNGSTPLYEQWVSDNGAASGAFANLPGANSNSLVLNPAALSPNVTYIYKLIATNFLGGATSAPVRVTAAAIPQAPAQGFSWGPVAAAQSDSDVVTNGATVLALVANSSVTINGVTFQPFVPAGVTLPQGPGDYYQGNESSISADTNGVTATLTAPNSTSSSPFYWYNAFASSSPPFSQLSAAYKALLSGADGSTTGADTWDLSITGLQPGSNYLFQLWVDDSRGIGNIGDRYVILSDGGTSPTSQSQPLQYETPLTGGVGNYDVGATKADSSGNINITILGGNDTQVNAFQLRELNSPGSNTPPFLSPIAPVNVVEYAGQTGPVNFGVVVSGSEPLSYQWLAGSGGAFAPLSGATSVPLALNTTGYPPGNYQYELVASNVAGAVTSAVVSLSVVSLPAPPPTGVAWGPAATILGDSDVATNGSSILAGVANDPITINGVAFASFLPADANTSAGSDYPSQDTFVAETNGAASAVLTSQTTSATTTPFYWYGSFGKNETAYAALSSSYQSLLTGGIGAWGGGDPWTFTIGGLTAGHTYEIQFWADDSRQNGFGRNDRLGDTNAGVVLKFNSSPTGANGGLGQFSMGTAKADSDGNIAFGVVGGDSLGLFNPDTQVNALQIRDITGAVITPVTLTITRSGANVIVSWNGAGELLQAPTVLGPWSTNNSATSPYTTPAAGAQQFFKVQTP